MDRATLIKAMGNEHISDEECRLFNEALIAAKCTNVQRASMFCAQVGQECDGMRTYEEYASGAAYEGRADLGNTQRGDGVRFKGRGLIQLTGRNNYGLFSRWAYDQKLVPSPTYFVDNPAKVGDLPWAFTATVWYWIVARPKINSMCDDNDIYGVTRAINGGLTHIDERIARWNRCRALGNAILPTTKEEFLMSLDDNAQKKVLGAAIQTGDAQVADPANGVIGPRPQRHTQYYNVDGNPSLAKAGKKLAYLRAMVMDLWNELVFDGYVAEVEDPALDSGRYGSLVGFVIASHKNVRETRLLTQAIAEKVGVDTKAVLAPKTEEKK